MDYCRAAYWAYCPGHRSGTTNQFDAHDPRTDTWAALPDAPHLRDHCQAGVLGHKLYVVGGRNTSYHEPANFMAFFSHTERAADCYDFFTGRWSTLPNSAQTDVYYLAPTPTVAGLKPPTCTWPATVWAALLSASGSTWRAA